MKKQLLVATLVAVTAGLAQANPVKGSAQGSSQMAKGSLASVEVTLNEISKGVASTVESTADAASRLVDGSKFVIQHPSQASQMAVDSTVNASQWVLTQSGALIRLAGDGSIAFIKDPSASTSKAIEASGNAITWTVDSTGRMVSASGNYLKNTSGEAVRLVMTGSGEVFKATQGSVVVTIEASGATLAYLGASTSKTLNVSRETASAIVLGSAGLFEAGLNASGSVFRK